MSLLVISGLSSLYPESGTSAEVLRGPVVAPRSLNKNTSPFGVSFATPQEDEEVALAGISHAGLETSA